MGPKNEWIPVSELTFDGQSTHVMILNDVCLSSAPTLHRVEMTDRSISLFVPSHRARSLCSLPCSLYTLSLYCLTLLSSVLSCRALLPCSHGLPALLHCLCEYVDNTDVLTAAFNAVVALCADGISQVSLNADSPLSHC
jgi:hypothetical protein